MIVTNLKLSADVAARLLEIKAIQLQPNAPFTWASGLRSPIYCDNRLLLSYPSHRTAVAQSFVTLSAQFSAFDAIAGVATAGIPHGALLADKLELPFIYIRDKAKSHGRQNQIEGKVTPGMRVLVIEDLISTGGSALKAVEALREAGCFVTGLMAIFTYGFAASELHFAQAECPFSTLTDYSTMLQVAQKEGIIAVSDLQTLERWRADPQAWSAAF